MAAEEETYQDNNRLSGRARRYARVGGTVGGLAIKVAGNKLFGMQLDKDLHAKDLQAALGGLKGPLMKVAQILSTIPDVLPEEYVKELRKLQSSAPPMGWGFVRRRMNSELGRGWQEKFESFEHDAAAAASLGQVHCAVSLDGHPLACKIQYPDMESAVEADLKQLKLAFSLYRQYDRAIDPSQIHTELSERLREELDYDREARNMALYRDILSADAEVHVPDVLPDLSTKRLLTMTWLDGQPLMDQLDRSLEDRNKIALAMFRAWYVPFYHCGVIHGDPHLGNYAVREDGSINLLDFGCVRIFPAKFVGAVIDLYRALRDDDMELAAHSYEVWGFKNLDKELMDVLNQWARFLYGPLLKDQVQTIQEEGGTMYGATVAEKVHKELKRLGGVTPPREFVLMDRAAIGLGSVFTHLNAEINWHRLFHELTDDFDVSKLEAKQQKALEKAGVPLAY